jgi:O-antigen/teichoic acid export membrane protein
MAAGGYLRGVLTLLSGNALAQAIPLALAPLLARLYAPGEFGHYYLTTAIAANVAVVACGRYEFALPMAPDDVTARRLAALCLRLLIAVGVVCTVLAIAWVVYSAQVWLLVVPPAVVLLGGLSLATMWAVRQSRAKHLSIARMVQDAGAAFGQVAAGWLHAGLGGLLAAWLLACALALTWLRLPGWNWRSTRGELRAVATQYRNFPLLNTPHAFLGALQDTLALALVAAAAGPAAAGAWGLCLRILKAPATLVGGAVSQALYPRLTATPGASAAARERVRQTMCVLGLVALLIVAVLLAFAPPLFALAFGDQWPMAGDLARALAVYIGVHFVASPLGVVTLAWNAQAFALKLAVVGQLGFLASLALGLQLGGLVQGGWCVSAATALYFGWYFWRLANWPAAQEPAP